jgi:hypothetical protein
MTQTTIYLSVIHGKDTLTLDGNLNLFKELLTTLNNAVKELPQADSALPVEDPKQTEAGIHVKP